MIKKIKSINIYPTIIVALSLLFIAGYFINQHFNALNWSKHVDGNDEFDYLLTPWSESFLVALLITVGMILVTQWSLRLSNNITALIIFAWVFYAAVILSLFDMTFGSWGIPGRCGDGFSLGNCFLADGLSELIYYAAIPIGFIIGTILLIINKRLKSKKLRQQNKP